MSVHAIAQDLRSPNQCTHIRLHVYYYLHVHVQMYIPSKAPQLTFLILHDLIIKQIPVGNFVLQFINPSVDELSEVLEVEQLTQELLHVGTRLEELVFIKHHLFGSLPQLQGTAVATDHGHLGYKECPGGGRMQ